MLFRSGVSDRRELVKAVSGALRDGDAQDKTLVQLLYRLARDGKWEVRQDLADILPLVPDEHFADLAAMAKAAGQKLDVPATKFMIRECSKEIDALHKLGVKFSGPHPEGPHGTPRMHVIQPDCRAMAEVLVKACKKANVRIACNMPGAELVLDNSGQVVGVREIGRAHV